MQPTHPAKACSVGQQLSYPHTGQWRLTPAQRLFAVFALYLLLRWLLLGGMAPVHFSDTPSYVEQYRNGFASGLFGRVRSWGYPFIIWLAGHHLGVVVAAQRLAGALSWFALALAAAGLFRHAAARRVAFWGTLLISLALFSLIWDVMLLSESFSNSFFLLLTAVGIWFLSSKSTGLRPLALMIALALSFAGLRDSNVLILSFNSLCAVVVLGLHYFRHSNLRPSRRASLAAQGLAGLLLLICLAHLCEMRSCRRNWQSVGAVFSMYVYLKPIGNVSIANNESIDWLAQHHGLPVADARARIGKTTYQPPPLTPAYEAWLKQTGPKALLDFMIHHPQWVLDTFNANSFYGMMEAGMIYLKPPDPWRKAHLRLPYMIQWTLHMTLDRLLCIPWSNILLTLAGASLGFAWIIRTWHKGLDKVSCLLGILFWLIATSAAMVCISTFGDFYEPWRHAITGLLALYAAVPIISAAAVEKFI